MTPDTALRLARYLGTTAEFWLGLQTHYDIETARAGDRQGHRCHKPAQGRAIREPRSALSLASDTIFALSSGHGRAGVAVIRISGPAAGSVLDLMAAPRPKPRFAAYRRVRHPQTAEVLDDGLALWFAGPRSETGEDMAELQVHGGRAVVAAVLEAIGTIAGCRLAEPGEFARRAFENGKLDLTGVEGLADLIDAETAAQRRQALRQAEGALAKLYAGWRQRLIGATALLEAAIDFSDEADVVSDAVGRAREEVEALQGEINRHLDDEHRGELIRDGFQVVLAGPPNVGKSSLLNALARRDVAIVSAEAGTTRDVIEVKLDLDGLPSWSAIRPASASRRARWSRRASGARSPARRRPTWCCGWSTPWCWTRRGRRCRCAPTGCWWWSPSSTCWTARCCSRCPTAPSPSRR